jgi:hypothetical protein
MSDLDRRRHARSGLKTSPPWAAACGFLLLLVLGAGCSDSGSRPRVEGTVTFKGNPVAGQTLAFYSEGGKGEFFSHKISLLADGTFSGQVPAPGNYKVAIEESMAVQEGTKPATGRLTIPQKYRNPATSDLVWNIQAGDNKQDFVLKE